VKAQPLGKPGDPVRTDYGFHVIQVETRTDPELKPFEAVQDEAQQRAQVALQEKVFQAYLDELKKEIPYQVNETTAPKAQGGQR